MMERLMPYVEIVHTITSDNGKEFTGHGEITEALGAGFSSLRCSATNKIRL